MPGPDILIHLTAEAYGGVETHTYYLSQALREYGARVTLASQRKLALNSEWTDDLVRSGVRIVRPPGWARHLPGPLALIPARLHLALMLQSASYDVVVGQGHGGAFRWMKRFTTPGGLFLWHEYWYGVPTRSDEYKTYAAPPPQPLGHRMRAMVEHLDAVVVGCERARANLVHVQRIRQPIRIIPPLTQMDAAPRANDRHYGSGSCLRVIMVGRLGYGKGLGAVLEAWPQLRIGDAELHLWGPLDSKFARESERRYGRQPGITFHGAFERQALSRILMEADLGLMLSIEEGYGLVGLEYMAHGLPFVMTDCGAAREFTRDNPDALMAPVSLDGIRQSIEELAERIRGGRTSRSRLQYHYREHFAVERAKDEHMRALLGGRSYWFGSQPARA